MESQRYEVVPPPELAEDDEEDCRQPRELRRAHHAGRENHCSRLLLPALALVAAVALCSARGFLGDGASGIAAVGSGGLEGLEEKFSMFQFSMAAYEKLFGDTDPFVFQCPVPGMGATVGMNLPGGGDRIDSCCAGYNHLGWPFQFPECSHLGLCTTCWEETGKAEMAQHPAIGFAAAAWAASVTVTGEAKPKYGWLGQTLSSTFGDLVSGDLANGLAVDDAQVQAKKMTVRLGRGIMGGKAEVCPGIQDWSVDMLNEAKENIHARVFKSAKAKLAIVAFRGTQLQSMKNWHVDADIHRVPLDLGNGNYTLVHEGFIKALNHVVPQVKRWVDGYVFGMFDAVPKDWDLIFAGHSLGGALAVLAATKAELEGWPRRPRATIVFGAPRVADSTLDSWWQSRGLCDRLIRVNTYNDVIHVMPFHKMWNAWNVATDAVDCIRSPLDCLKHSAVSAEDMLIHPGSPPVPPPGQKSLEISTQWAHVCPQSEVLIPSRVKGINQQLEEMSLFGGVLAHLTDNCFYGYAYGVLHSNITHLDQYCGSTAAVCSELSHVGPK